MSILVYDPVATLTKLLNFVQTGGYVKAAQIGEPDSPAREDITAAIIMASITTAELSLTNPVERHNVIIRLYRDAFREPTSENETLMASASTAILKAAYADVTLNDDVRAIDVGGMYGPPVERRWGYIDVSGVLYRICDIALGFIVDGEDEPFAVQEETP